MDLKNISLQNTALLLIDIQNDYFKEGANPLEGSLQASIVARKLLEKFRKDGNPVVHVQHLSMRPGSSFFIPGTIGADIHANVEPLASEKVIVKNYPNSFRETGLQEYLQGKQIHHLVICGMMTHMCIDATTRAAKDLGYNCILVADACATKDLEINDIKVKASDVHHSFLAALGYFYAKVINADEIL